MNRKQSNQEWLQLQTHIAGFFGKALRNDMLKIEYKPLFIAKLTGDAVRTSADKLQEMSI